MSIQLIASETITISMHECPRWDRCSAGICPLTIEGSHVEGDDICKYVVEAAKGENGISPSGKHSEEIMAAARYIWANKDQLPFALRKPLMRAAKSPSRRNTRNLVQDAA